METAVELFIIVISSTLFTILSLIVHELGHLLCGLLTGYRFLSFRLLYFTWVREGGRIKVTRQKDTVVSGQCLMVPPRAEGCPVALYNLGGGFANLLLAGICLVAMLAANGIDSLVGLVFLVGVVVNIFQGLINLLAQKL
jgi:hypothetical protein